MRIFPYLQIGKNPLHIMIFLYDGHDYLGPLGYAAWLVPALLRNKAAGKDSFIWVHGRTVGNE